MARTSGPARAGLIEGAFTHARSGIRYRVYAEGDQAMLSFERPGGRSVAGRVSLKYFVGSLLFGPIVTIVLAATRQDKAAALRQVDLWKGRRAA